MKIGRGVWGVSVVWLLLLFVCFSTLAAPRFPLPPWPEGSSGIFGWDSQFWQSPVRLAANEESAALVESWSGYALRRDSLTTGLPVAIPGIGNQGRVHLSPSFGATRFWFSPNWSSANAFSKGGGPGHFARLLELVDWSGPKPQTRWSLYVSPDGGEIFFSGLGVSGGATDFLSVPVEFVAGDWWAVTVCWGPTNSQLWLNDQLMANGSGVASAGLSSAAMGLVVGSDVAAQSPAEGLFEELKVFDYWPDEQQQSFYFKGVSRHVRLGTVGTEAEELAKHAALQMLMEEEDGPPPVPGEGEGGGGEGGESYVPLAYDYPSNSFWLEITGVTNGFAYVTIHGTEPENVYELLSKESLTNTLWLSEGTVFGADGLNWTPTAIPVLERTNYLFLRARSWVDSDGGGLPDWWQLEYFGHLGVDPYGDPDDDGWMNIEEYQNGTHPNFFNTPRAPAGFTAWIGGSGQQVELSWEIPMGDITSYLIERDTGAGFQSLASVGANDSSFTNYYTVTNDYTFYRIKANYAGGSSAYSEPVNPVIESRSSIEAAVVRGSEGRLYLVASHMPADVTVLRVTRYVFDVHYPLLRYANYLWEDGGWFDPGVNDGTFDVPAAAFTNGVYQLPVSEVPLFGDYDLYIQALGQNGKKGKRLGSFYFRQDADWVAENRAIPFLDGREQIRQNVEFFLRVGKGYSDVFGSEEPFNLYFERTVQGTSDTYLNWGHHDYVFAGFHYYDLFVGQYERLFFDELQPFEQNHFLSNFVFSTANVSTNGAFLSGASWNSSFSFPEYYYGVASPLSLFSTYGYVTDPNTNLLAAVLSTNVSQWLFAGSAASLGFFGWDLQNSYTVPNNFRNLYGLVLKSVKWPGASSPATFPTATTGQTIYPGSGAYFVEMERPILSTVNYYFARHDVEPLPGEPGFEVTNTTPLLITNVGTPFFLTAWAKQSILNGYSDKFAFPEQYFDKAYKMNTNGVATTNETGILSPYGEFFPTEPGATALITLPDAATGARGTAVVHVISLNVDGNHDGIMDFSYFGPDQATPNRPYRFWINDDDDADETKGNDIPGQNSAKVDYRDTISPGIGQVDGVRDLVDFFPVYLNIQSVLQAFPESTVSVFLKQEDSALNYIDPSWYVDTDLGPTNCLTYLTETNVALEIGRIGLPSATTLQVTDYGGLPLKSAFVNKIRDEGKGMLLLEARRATSKPLVLELRTNNQVFARAELPLSITGVEQMFRQKNLIQTVLTNSTAGWPDRLSDADVPNEPDTNDKNFVFLHGYNVNPNQARGAFAETFKRLYWSGSHAKFYGLNYYGYESQVGSITPNLQINIVNAFLTAPAVKSFLDTLTNGPTTLAAHSLGNMVALSALNDWHAQVDKYFMINAAVAIEAIDGSTAWSTNMVHSDWLNYTSRLWASQWFRLFPTNDYRNTLTWSNRLANLPITNIYNFYSSGEEVLRTHFGPTPDFSGFALGAILDSFRGTPPGAHVWALQEKLKGRSPFNGVLSSFHGGWKFNDTSYGTNLFGGVVVHMSPANAALLPDSQLRTNAFFDVTGPGYSVDTALFGVNGSAYAQANRNRILSDAIPALTLPVAANPVPVLQAIDQNRDMNSLYQNGWPSTRPGGQEANKWYHSDFKNVAYLYVHKLFEEFVTQGNLK